MGDIWEECCIIQGHSALKNYTIAVVAVCNSDLSTHTKLLQVAQSAFDIVAHEEIIIATGTVLRGGEPVAGPVCGQQAPREYTPGTAPDVEHAEGRWRQQSAIVRLHKECFTVQMDLSTHEPVCQCDEMRDHLKWQKERFGAAQSDDTDRIELYDVDAAYTILFLMARALENGGPVLCVSLELCMFMLQEQVR